MRKYCVIGFPVKHSLSPRLHNKAFKELKIKARYEAIEIAPKKLAGFMKSFRENFSGANITIPYKEAIIEFLDALSPEAERIGAVNTILNKKGKLIGYNTDVFGAMDALKKSGVRLCGKKTIVLGAGGAARAVVYGLKKNKSKVIVSNRTFGRAKKLAKEFGCEAKPFNKIDLRHCGVIINVTSVGMWREKFKMQNLKFKSAIQNSKVEAEGTLLSELPARLAKIKKKPVVMDIIYRPRMTKLLKDAKKAGCKIITGDKMFLGQAAAAFKIWTGRTVCFSAIFSKIPIP